ncbi:MAG: dockerin type I domain-containing protein [Longicatena sp.]
MKKGKRALIYSISAIMIVSCLLCFKAGNIFGVEESSDTTQEPDSYADKTGLYMAVDKEGNVKYIKPEVKDISDELKVPEETDKKTTFDLKRQIGDGEPITIHSYDSFEEANAAMNRQARFRGVGALGVYTGDQLRSIQNGVVNFATKSDVTNYTSVDGTAGYLYGPSGADGAYLGTNQDGTKIKFKISGVVGWVNIKEEKVKIMNYDSAEVASVNFYKVEDGRIYHYITSNISSTYYASTVDVGPAQSYMKEKDIYYSYDGHYFYTSYAQMISDYKANTEVYPNSINPQTPYYNYYQYLSHRTKTNFTASDMNTRITNVVQSEASALKNQGSNFVKSQDTYGANAALMFGLSINESGWGQSNYALNRNNIFGHAAFDSNPDNATMYPSVAESIRQHAQTYISGGYLDPLDYRYFGSHLGDKASGMNVKYASDQYWGEKAATQSYALNKIANRNDYKKYTLGIKKNGINLSVRKEPSSDATMLYSTKNTNDYPFVILDTVQGSSVDGNTTWYKIQSDVPLSSDRSKALQFKPGEGAEFNYNNDYAYVSAAYVYKASEGTGIVVPPEKDPVTPPDPVKPPTEEPAYMKGDVNGDGYISSRDYNTIKNHITGYRVLSGNDLKKADVNGDGYISSRDYNAVKNHITGYRPLN